MRWMLILTLVLAPAVIRAGTHDDQAVEAAVQRALRAYALNAVRPDVRDGAVTLTGSVGLCRDRLLADELAGRVQGVKSIDDRIDVSGPPVPDSQLKADVDGIIARRHHMLGWFGYGSISARVQDGIVDLSGTAAPELAAPSISAIAGMLGVRNVIDRIHRVPPYDSSWRRSHPPEAIP